MKFGFELEAFLKDAKSGDLVLVPKGIPMDDCGWLVEYRGEAQGSCRQAVGSLLAEVYCVDAILKQRGLVPLMEPVAKVPRQLKLAARREHIKGVLKYQNLYGFAPSTADTAGLHLSITRPISVRVEGGGGYPTSYNLLWDFPQLFFALDRRYGKLIKEAKRKPGFYEIKSDQRIEYRSLPNTVDLWDLAVFVDGWKF